jgi:hypothetical protein
MGSKALTQGQQRLGWVGLPSPEIGHQAGVSGHYAAKPARGPAHIGKVGLDKLH